MRIIITLSLLLLLSFSALAQSAFHEGYLITHAGDTIHGFIRNVDWSKNAANIRFKKTLDSETEVYDATTIHYFSVDNLKFMSATVMLDESSDDNRNLTTFRAPKWTMRTGFIKVLVEGKANLFMYDDNKRRRFYYTHDYDSLYPLVFKRYSPEMTIVKKNNLFQQQLYNYVNCNVTAEEVLTVNYNLKSLERYFTNYNKCSGSEPRVYSNVTREHTMHLTPKIGYGMVSGDLLLINRISSSYSTELSGVPQISMGIEFEYVMSFERNRFSLYIQPGYQQFEFEEYNSPDSLTIQGTYLTVQAGARYSIYRGEVARWFIGAGYMHFIPMGAEYTYRNEEYVQPERTRFDLTNAPGIHVSTGYVFENHLSVQARMDLRFDIRNDYLLQSPTFTTFSLEIGYSIF